MQSRDEALFHFKEFLEEIKAIGKKPPTLIIRSDNDHVYVAGQFQQYCRENGIMQETTAQYIHEHNGLAEVNFS